MGLDIWFREDVQRQLTALARAASRYDGEYRQGYFDALGDVAASFGLPVQDAAMRPGWHVLGPGNGRGQVTVYDERGHP